MNEIEKYIIFFFMTVVLSGCSEKIIHWQPVEGYVLEERTDTIVDDAIVLARWVGISAYNTSICFNLDVVTTDSRGRFYIPAWSNTGPYNNINQQRIEYYVFKKGFIYKGRKNNNLYIAHFVGSYEERANSLIRASNRFRCTSGPNEKLNIIITQMYNELISIARTEEDKARAERLKIH